MKPLIASLLFFVIFEGFAAELPPTNCAAHYSGLTPIAELNSFSGLEDPAQLARIIQRNFHLKDVQITKLNGTSGYQFTARYRGRAIKFESTREGEELSGSLGHLIKKSKTLIDEEHAAAMSAGRKPPQYVVYPELLDQKENYHFLYQENYLARKFKEANGREPTGPELAALKSQSRKEASALLFSAETATDEAAYFNAIMHTPRIPDQVTSVEEAADRIMAITSPQYQAQIRRAMTEKSSPSVKKSIVDVYNAFNSPRFDQFMSEIALRALKLCREAKECGPNQRTGIPDKFLALLLHQESKQLGVPLEVISRYVGREPGRLYHQRIRRGSLMLDEGAPGNHGVMPHSLQNLFIYQQIGPERAKEFFAGLSGWTYERMFDANAAFLPIPSTRDITRRHYWTGVFKAGERSDVIKYGELAGELGRYPDFLRKNGLELEAVEEIEQNLLNAGSVVRAKYKGREFTFTVDRDGAPSPEAAEAVEKFKKSVDSARSDRNSPATR